MSGALDDDARELPVWVGRLSPAERSHPRVPFHATQVRSRMRLLPLAAVAVATLVLAACSPGGDATPAPTSSAVPPGTPAPTPATGTAPTMADLDARTFIVTDARGHEIVDGTTISLRFEDGRLGMSAGCNQMSGSYELTDGVLTVGQMVTTEMGCEQALMDQDGWIGGFVNGATLILDGDTLTLVNGGVTLTATDKRVAMPDLPIEGTAWTVDGLVSADAVSSMPGGVAATLVFADGQVSVDAGCNRGSGSATIAGGTITFGPIATTKMACGPAAMTVERHVLGVLQGAVRYSIDSDSLTLIGDGVGLTGKGS
jgi:heat shock protein HslJ